MKFEGFTFIALRFRRLALTESEDRLHCVGNDLKYRF